MAVVNSDFLQGMMTNFRVIWEDAFLAAQTTNPIDRYATVVPSNTDRESYNWFGTVPKMREWIDERQVEGLKHFNYELRNKHYEVTIEVDRDAYEDDRYGELRPRIAQLGDEAGRYPSELAVTTLVAGGSSAGYDGANFFATTHQDEAEGTQSNAQTGTGTTLAQVRADFVAARTAMRRIKDGKGRVMNLRPDLVIVPPDLEDVFEQLIHTNMIALSSGTQQSNVLLNAVDIQVESLLTDTTDWFLLCTRQIIKPLIFQTRKAPEFVSNDDPRDSRVFSNKTFRYGVDARFNAGYGLWQMIQRVANA